MADLIIIRNIRPPLEGREVRHRITLWAERTTLNKRRWRAAAEDGREFGFDLEEPLPMGCSFYREDDLVYVLEQRPEEVLEIPVTSLEQAARVAWNLGNLHFGVQVLSGAVRVKEDPAVLQLLEREKIFFARVSCVFLPLSSGSHHHHHHDHA